MADSLVGQHRVTEAHPSSSRLDTVDSGTVSIPIQRVTRRSTTSRDGWISLSGVIGLQMPLGHADIGVPVVLPAYRPLWDTVREDGPADGEHLRGHTVEADSLPVPLGTHFFRSTGRVNNRLRRSTVSPCFLLPAMAEKYPEILDASSFELLDVATVGGQAEFEGASSRFRDCLGSYSIRNVTDTLRTDEYSSNHPDHA